MRTIFKYLAMASAMVLTLGACTEKAPEYEPADPAGTAEVYFVPGQPTSYNLKELDGSFDITLCRVVSTNALTVNLASTADDLFTIPASVSFDSGAKEAVLTVTYDATLMEEDHTYPVSIKISDNTSPYGNAEYSFDGVVPAAWELYGHGIFNECPDWWGEVEEKDIFYQDLGDGIYLMKIPECFGHDTIAAGDPYDVQDYIFYWDTETNTCRVPAAYMGYSSATYGQYWFGDNASFYELYYGPDYWGDKTWEEYFRGDGTYMPYYDEDLGIFYLADQYFYAPEPYSTHWGYGNWDLTPDSFWLDGFVRTTDYNDDDHIGASSALFEGYASSMIFSVDGETPLEFDASLRYDADYELEEDSDEEVTTTYYLKEYFDADHCLAFTAPIPEQLEDGSKITAVDNEQATGVIIFGNELFVTVKKGSVSWPDGEEFPEFTIVCVVDTRDAEGTVVNEFGTWTEVYTANDYGKDFYTTADLYGGYFEDYLGQWIIHAVDFSDGQEYAYLANFEDAGDNKVKITNLSGYNGGMSGTLVDELYATWKGYVLYLTGQELENKVTYSGNQYAMTVYPWDPDTDSTYNPALELLGGICSDGNLAFVNNYADYGVNLVGFAYVIDGLGWYTKFYNIWAESYASSSLNREDFYEPGPVQVMKERVKVSDQKIGKDSRQLISTQSVKAQRVINLQPIVKGEKSEPTTTLVTLK
ncbi:MAG: hypothetical protein J6W74_04270 [Bacteroidales bacterium]|nr:hypothetical protein [Bacteroidales bacterium]